MVELPSYDDLKKTCDLLMSPIDKLCIGYDDYLNLQLDWCMLAAECVAELELPDENRFIKDIIWRREGDVPIADNPHPLISGEDLMLRCGIHGIDVRSALLLLGGTVEPYDMTSSWNVVIGKDRFLWFKDFKPIECPEEFDGSIDVRGIEQISKLSSLAGMPKIIKGSFFYSDLNVKDTSDGPLEVDGMPFSDYKQMYKQRMHSTEKWSRFR